MIVDVECERCRGEGWLLTREPRLGSDAQRRTIEGLFSIMLYENPREAETLLIRLQRQMRNRQAKGANVG